MSKEERIYSILKEILLILKYKEFDKIFNYVTNTDLGELSDLPTLIEEFIQGTVAINGFTYIDEFRTDSYCVIDETYEDKVVVEYILTADEGHKLQLCLRIEILSEDVLLSVNPC